MKFITRSFLAALFTILLIALLQGSALGQANLGSIKGEVKDVRDAVVPVAQLTLTNEATGVAVGSRLGPTGQFSFVDLNPGTYTLSTEAAGFRTSVQQHIVVGVGQTVPLDVVRRLAM